MGMHRCRTDPVHCTAVRIIHRALLKGTDRQEFRRSRSTGLSAVHPELFGGAGYSAWAFNFQPLLHHQHYDESNAFESIRHGFRNGPQSVPNLLPAERQLARTDDGIPLASFRQLSQHVAVLPHGSANCIGARCHLGPVGKDGYPQQLWDRTSGAIDSTVAKYWHDHGDLAYYAQANWTRIGSQLDNKLHFYVGEMDTFREIRGCIVPGLPGTTHNPHYRGTFEYAPTKGDWQPMTDAQLVQTMADHIARNEPAKPSCRGVTTEPASRAKLTKMSPGPSNVVVAEAICVPRMFNLRSSVLLQEGMPADANFTNRCRANWAGSLSGISMAKR